MTSMTSMTKTDLYNILADDLAERWYRDAALLERNPTAWTEAWTIDEWLVEYRDDRRVSVKQYQRNCDRLRGIYHVGPRATPSPKGDRVSSGNLVTKTEDAA